MNTELFLVPLLLVSVLAIGIWAIINGRGHISLKYGFTALLTIVCIVIWSIYTNVSGWPTVESVPVRYEVEAVAVNTPLKDREGYIVFLVKDLTDQNYGMIHFVLDPKNTPRAYKFPYTKQSHEQAQQIQEMLKKGQRVFMMSDGKGGKGKGKGKKNGDGTGQMTGRGGAGGYQFESKAPFGYIMPPPVPKDK